MGKQTIFTYPDAQRSSTEPPVGAPFSVYYRPESGCGNQSVASAIAYYWHGCAVMAIVQYVTSVADWLQYPLGLLCWVTRQLERYSLFCCFITFAWIYIFFGRLDDPF